MSKSRRRKAGNTLIPVLLGGTFVTFIVVFAFQTWFLVDWLFPSTNAFMKVGTVFSFDVMSIIWAMTDTFYEFYKWRSKHIVQAMWGITFVLATVASIIQLYLASTTHLEFVIDPNVIKLAYGMVIAALAGNLIALTFVFKIEWAASHPSYVQEDFEVQEDSPTPTYALDEMDTEDDLEPVPQLTAPRAQAVQEGQSVKSRIAGAVNVLRGKPAPQAAPQPSAPAQPTMTEEQMYEWLERANRRIEERAKREEEAARKRVDGQERNSTITPEEWGAQNFSTAQGQR